MPSPKFAAILRELQELHDKKDAEYSGDEPLSNYKTAEEWGDPAWKSSLLRAEEKRKRLQNMWKAGKTLRRDDFLDLIGHWINTLILREEDAYCMASKGLPYHDLKCFGRSEEHIVKNQCGWICPVCEFVCE